MLGIIGAALAAITEGLKLANTAASRAHINDIAKLQLRVKKAEERPYDEQDDAEIVSLYKELKIAFDKAAAIIQMEYAK